jgi:hypothetical protein
MLRHTRLALVLALLGALLLVPSAFAKGGTGGGGGGGTGGGGGGGGGGGTTLKYGAINGVSGIAACDAGTSMSVSLSKGTNNQILGTMNMVGGTNPDGTSTLFGSWSLLLHNDTTGASVGGVAGETFGETVPSVLIKLLFSGVPAGSYDLTLTGTKTAFGSPPISDNPVLETCTTHFAVIAR